MTLRIVISILVLCLGLYVFLWLKTIWSSISRNLKLEKSIQPAIDAAMGTLPDAADRIAEVAAAPATRNYLYKRLVEIGKQELFPAQYRDLTKVAESDLTQWLMHPNELGDEPEDMGLVRSIPVDEGGRSGAIFLFRFRAKPSHWAAKFGWMAGIAGPYWANEEPAQIGSETFSELIPFESMTVEEHVEFLRAKLTQKGLIVRA